MIVDPPPIAFEYPDGCTIKGRLRVLERWQYVGKQKFENGVDVDGQADIKGPLDVTGNGTISGTLSGTGAASFASTLGVNGATSLGHTLGVQGAATLAHTLTVAGKVTVNNAADVTGKVFAGGLEVTGVTTLGVTTAATTAATDNSTRVATTAHVATKIAELVASSPALLDTLNELAAAIGDDPNFAATMATQLGTKAPINAPALTGAATAVTPPVGEDSGRIATTAYVKNQGYTTGAGYAPLAGPDFTGIATSQTPPTAEDSTRIANTAWVRNQGYRTSDTSTAGLAPINNPSFTGNNCLCPTPSTNSNDTKMANTAFVKAQGYTVSDVRFKADIEPVTDVGRIIDGLGVYTYRLLLADEPYERRMGLMAQEVKRFFPEAVEPIGDDPLAPVRLDLKAIVPLLFAEVKSLRARVSQLERGVA